MALVLTRMEGEAIVLTINGERITITCTGLSRSRLRVIVDAPPSVRIVRSEIELQRKHSNGHSDDKISEAEVEEIISAIGKEVRPQKAKGKATVP